jgi:hypothetical protein
MVDENILLARARDYMKELSEGRDPLTGREIASDSVLDEPRMRKCFGFVAAYIQRELTRATQGQEYFFPNDEQIDALCDEQDMLATDFYDRICAAAAAEGKRAVTPRQINHFLLREALVDGRVESMFVERRVLRANDCSAELGIYDKPHMSPRTGALTYALMLTPDAQAWLCRMLPALIEQEKRLAEEERS